MKILLPKVYDCTEILEEVDRNHPLFFLGGPVRGGGDWQVEMATLLAEREPECIIAIPTRWQSDHPLSERFLHGEGAKFVDQLDWERMYLKCAGTDCDAGCVVFWLGLESKTNPHPGPEPYSMDTRGELGEWRMRMRFQNARVVLGGHPGFFGSHTIKRNYTRELGYEFPIYQTMEEVADEAVRCALNAKVP